MNELGYLAVQISGKMRIFMQGFLPIRCSKSEHWQPVENTLVEVETVQTIIATMHSLWVAKTFCYNYIISGRKKNEWKLLKRSLSHSEKKEETMYLCSKYDAVHTIYESIIEWIEDVTRPKIMQKWHKLLLNFHLDALWPCALVWLAAVVITRKQLAISVNDGLAAGLGAQHCSISVLHSGSQ